MNLLSNGRTAMDARLAQDSNKNNKDSASRKRPNAVVQVKARGSPVPKKPTPAGRNISERTPLDTILNEIDAFQECSGSKKRPTQHKESSKPTPARPVEPASEEGDVACLKQLPPTPVPSSTTLRPLTRNGLIGYDDDESMVQRFMQKSGLMERLIGYKMMRGRLESYTTIRANGYNLDDCVVGYDDNGEKPMPEPIQVTSSSDVARPLASKCLFPANQSTPSTPPVHSTTQTPELTARRGPRTPPGSPPRQAVDTEAEDANSTRSSRGSISQVEMTPPPPPPPMDNECTPLPPPPKFPDLGNPVRASTSANASAQWKTQSLNKTAYNKDTACNAREGSRRLLEQMAQATSTPVPQLEELLGHELQSAMGRMDKNVLLDALKNALKSAAGGQMTQNGYLDVTEDRSPQKRKSPNTSGTRPMDDSEMDISMDSENSGPQVSNLKSTDTTTYVSPLLPPPPPPVFPESSGSNIQLSSGPETTKPFEFNCPHSRTPLLPLPKTSSAGQSHMQSPISNQSVAAPIKFSVPPPQILPSTSTVSHTNETPNRYIRPPQIISDVSNKAGNDQSNQFSKSAPMSTSPAKYSIPSNLDLSRPPPLIPDILKNQAMQQTVKSISSGGTLPAPPMLPNLHLPPPNIFQKEKSSAFLADKTVKIEPNEVFEQTCVRNSLPPMSTAYPCSSKFETNQKYTQSNYVTSRQPKSPTVKQEPSFNLISDKETRQLAPTPNQQFSMPPPNFTAMHPVSSTSTSANNFSQSPQKSTFTATKQQSSGQLLQKPTEPSGSTSALTPNLFSVPPPTMSKPPPNIQKILQPNALGAKNSETISGPITRNVYSSTETAQTSSAGGSVLVGSQNDVKQNLAEGGSFPNNQQNQVFKTLMSALANPAPTKTTEPQLLHMNSADSFNTILNNMDKNMSCDRESTTAMHGRPKPLFRSDSQYGNSSGRRSPQPLRTKPPSLLSMPLQPPPSHLQNHPPHRPQTGYNQARPNNIRSMPQATPRGMNENRQRFAPERVKRDSQGYKQTRDRPNSMQR
ncbi:hypothetical protein Ddc_03552 [Ditylenchus destructor]|nr:hypothetical protein Ddc_03552 [Ditylenchus destructor]